MESKILTAARIEHLRPGLYRDSKGLYLKVGPNGGKSWVFRYMLAGVARHAGLGPYPEISLAGARKLAEEWRIKLNGPDPVDPLEERRKAKAALAKHSDQRFGAAAQSWLALKGDKWTNAYYRKQVERQLRQYCAAIWNTPLKDIDTPTIINLLEGEWKAHRVTASKVRMYIEGVIAHGAFKWQIASLDPNPARWEDHLEHHFAAPKESDVKSIPGIPVDEMQSFAADLRARDGLKFRALELLMLCGLRSDDVRTMRWEHLNGDWRNPDVSKTHKPLTVPLCDRAHEILNSLPRLGPYVFPGRNPNQPLGGHEMQRAMKAIKPGCTPHGLRKSFRTWAGERTSTAPDTIEVAIGHIVGNRVERTYNEGELLEKRRLLMQAWSEYLQTKARPC